MVSDLEDALFLERAKRGRENFEQYVRAIRWTQGDKFKWNWHLSRLSYKLNEFAHGRIIRLMVFMPPRHAKSEFGSRLLPGFIFGLNPDTHIILVSYAADMAEDLSIEALALMDEPAYKIMFPQTRLPISGAKGKYRRTNRYAKIIGGAGSFRATGIGGPISGKPAHVVIIDDPVKNQKEAESPTTQDGVHAYWKSTIYPRLEAIGSNPGSVLLIMTRWHFRDLAGRLLEDMKDADKATIPWEIVDFPALKEDNSNPEDPREIGEALWEWKRSREQLLEIKANLQSYWWPLFQQKPQQEGGSIFKRAWFSFYDPALFILPPPDVYIDTSYTEDPDNDRCAAVFYSVQGNHCYIRHVAAVWEEFPGAVAWIERLVKSIGGPSSRVYIEPKASGLSIAQHLKKHTNLNVIEDEPPTESKITRAKARAPFVEAGRVFLPTGAGWTEEFFKEITEFPKGDLDDIVDAFVGALSKSFGSAFDFW